MASNFVIEADHWLDGVEQEEVKRMLRGRLAEILEKWANDASDTDDDGKDFDLDVTCVGSTSGIKRLDVAVTEIDSGACTYYSLGPDGRLIETSPPPTLQQ